MKYLPNGLYCLDSDVKYNCRFKYYIDESGAKVPLEMMYARRFLFNPDGAEYHDKEIVKKRKEYVKKWNEIYEIEETGYEPLYDNAEENRRCSQRRASRKIRDIILCNRFSHFVTLTINPEQLDCKDYGAVVRKLNNFLDNMVRRKGLAYVGVPELHKKGGIHFHFLVRADELRLVDSGTVSCTGKKRPIKIATADRLGIPLEDRRIVYNLPGWKFGFTTAIEVYGEPMAVANYIGKYITKCQDKVGGRWYYSGGRLNECMFEYAVVDFDDVDCFDYEFSCDGGDFKVKKF